MPQREFVVEKRCQFHSECVGVVRGVSVLRTDQLVASQLHSCEDFDYLGHMRNVYLISYARILIIDFGEIFTE
jgi:hypothetical protein